MNKNERLDQGTYEVSKKYLKSVLEHMIEAGRDVRDLSEFALEKFGDEILPDLRRFISDVRQGNIDVKGLSQSAKAAILGHQVSTEERERMIRDAAYLRSERRGFVGGYEHDDWLAAEREVDDHLAKEAGLVAKGSKVVTSATAIVEKEFDSIKKVVSTWLEDKIGATQKAVKKAVTKKKASAPSKKASKPATEVTGKTVAKKEKQKAPAEKKTSVETKTVKKKTVKKPETQAKKLAE